MIEHISSAVEIRADKREEKQDQGNDADKEIKGDRGGKKQAMIPVKLLERTSQKAKMAGNFFFLCHEGCPVLYFS
jgi:hypothetical protein